MTNVIPQNAVAIFTQFNFNGGETLEGNEVVLDNKKRQELGINSIYKVSENMTLEKFYSVNKTIFDENYNSDEYKLLFAESKYRDFDLNHDEKISKEELESAISHQNRGQQYRIFPKKNETLNEYKYRALETLKDYDEKFEQPFKYKSQQKISARRVNFSMILGNEYVDKVFGERFDKLIIEFKKNQFNQ